MRISLHVAAMRLYQVGHKFTVVLKEALAAMLQHVAVLPES